MQKKKKYIVNYTESHVYEVIVMAASKEDAESMVLDGDADYDTARKIDSTLVDINRSEEVTE
jgi:hypothetical protein